MATVYVDRWSRWWVMNCLSAMIACCCSMVWTQCQTWSTVHARRARTPSSSAPRTVTTRWPRVPHVATCSASTAAQPTMALHRAASLQVVITTSDGACGHCRTLQWYKITGIFFLMRYPRLVQKFFFTASNNRLLLILHLAFFPGQPG